MGTGTEKRTESRAETDKLHVLFVDDETFVLDALRRTVRSYCNATFAEGGQEAVDILRAATEPFDVVCTDMRMPQVDGIAVLKVARECFPDTGRVLLTGQADLESAVAAVNEGNIFRFLLKPTSPEQLQTVLREAAELRRLKAAERELLEQTLKGSVQALFEILSLANPLAFARATRIRNTVARLLQRDASENKVPENKWEIEIAAMLSQVGAITLPDEITRKLEKGEELSGEHQVLVDDLPIIADHLLAPIPRLEHVREVIVNLRQWENATAPFGTKLIQLAIDVDRFQAQNMTPSHIAEHLSHAEDEYGDALMLFLEDQAENVERKIVRVSLYDIEIGMELAEDVYTSDGVLLIGHGQIMSESIVKRLRNYSRHSGLQNSDIAVVITLVKS